MAKGGDFETLFQRSNENNFRAKRNFEHIFEKVYFFRFDIK